MLLQIKSARLKASFKNRNSGFTLIELMLVLIIIAVVTSLAIVRSGSLDFWKEENFIRRLSETMIFLHYQAVVDQAFYRVEFDLERQTYQVGLLKVEEDIEGDKKLAELSDVGNVSLELSAYLNPSIGSVQTFIPPPSLPSLHEPVMVAGGSKIRDVRTMRGKVTDGKPFILFSPRGFSEFSVVHLVQSTGRVVTILVNPFTGNTEIYREDKDFEWTYGRKKKGEA